MSLLRDYNLKQISSTKTKVLAIVGDFVTIRRGSSNVTLNIKAYDSANGGELVLDVLVSNGDKVRANKEFKRLEIVAIDSTMPNVTLTAGTGNLESDSVAGEVGIAGIVETLPSIKDSFIVEEFNIEDSEYVGLDYSVLNPPANTYEISIVFQSGSGDFNFYIFKTDGDMVIPRDLTIIEFKIDRTFPVISEWVTSGNSTSGRGEYSTLNKMLTFPNVNSQYFLQLGANVKKFKVIYHIKG